MKIFSILLLLGLLYSCHSSSSPLEEKNTVTIQGICLDKTKTERYAVRNKYGIKEVEVSPSGFEIEITDCTAPSIVEVIVEKNKSFPIYIEPAKKLIMVYGETDIINRMNSIEYKGANALENKILFELGLYYKYHDPNESSFFNCSENIFINRLDSIKAIGFDLLEKKKSEFPSLKNSFLVSAKNYIEYSIAYYLEVYPQKIRGRFAKKGYQESGKYALYKNEKFKEDASLLNCASYLYYIDTKRSNLSSKIRFSEGYPKSGNIYSDVNSEFMAIDSIFSEKKIIDYLRYLAIWDAIFFREKDDIISKYFAIYKRDTPSPYYINSLEPQIKNLTKTYLDGMFFSTYSFLDANDRKHVLEEYKGKVLYIDLWATWCFPCHQERKYFEKLIDDFDTKDITFIGISLDKQKDKEKWKEMVKKSNIKGIQLLADNDFESQICKDFNIKLIPRFILIDSKGKIVQANAIRPSDPEINEVLSNLIEK